MAVEGEMAMATTTGRLAAPTVRVRGRSFMALIITPEFPMSEWFTALDAQMRGSPELFAGRPMVADLSATSAAGPDAALIVLDGLEARGLRIVGVEGVDPRVLARTRWERLATSLHGRDLIQPREAPAPAAREPAPSLLIEESVRSGQVIDFESGDVTIVGAVASGAEVIAGGSIHVYGPLRGRAIAGLKAGESARIFCRKLEAELVGVARLFRTADNWGPDLHGRAVQVRCDRGSLRLSALD
ncbi:septum site-determining protein MinC [Phenylobacterium sp.]|jgi:septum site-determining protein MinC|uniref:septum site-determining protein MinC n=1 Tax=Phenylobacterium sp. TaxID=1871053 RepID=UPI002E3475B9|nr:septum site-determining protein MinC [Phenylobacterium sp.]HEX2559798.1 septum site-determining protein MinC [Phenylobacterium sp.]